MFTALVLTLATTLAAPPESSGLLLYSSFDGDLNANCAAGNPEAQVNGDLRFIDGRKGKAVVVGEEHYLSYFAAGNLIAPQGSIEFWMQPIDWDGTDDTDSHFFVGAAGKDRLYVYKFARWRSMTFHINPHTVTKYESLAQRIDPWKRGQWHHVVVTWDPASMWIYLNGTPRVFAQTPATLTDLGSRLYVGRDLATPQFAKGFTAIDELRVYARPLFPEEVKRAFTRIDDENAGVTHEPFRDIAMHYTGFPSRHEAHLAFTATTLVPDGGSGELIIRDPANDRVAIRQSLDVAQGGTLADCTIDTSALTPAAYDVTVRIKDADGDALLERTRKLLIRDRAWLTAKAGEPTEVPRPWTALRIKGRAIECWDRSYTLGDKALFDSMISGGHELLAAPIALHGTIDGQALRQASPWRLKSKSDLAIVVESSLAAGSVRGRQTMTIEFDGFVRYDFQITPPPNGAKVESLSFDIPYQPQFAKYYTTAAQRAKYYFHGAIPEDGWSGRDVFNIFIGDEDRGIDFMNEGWIDWPNQDESKQLQIIPQGDQTILRANLVLEPTTLREPFGLSFGLQATPSRPLDDQWRTKWRMNAETGIDPSPELAEQVGANVAIIWWSDKPNTPVWFGSPEPQDPEAFRATIDDFHRRGVKVLVYQNLTCVSPRTPEAIEYSGEWFENPQPAALPADDDGPLATWQHIRLNHPTWNDYIVGAEARTLDEYDIDGWYFDVAMPAPVEGRYPVFEYREACKRAYVALQQRRDDGMIITHASAHYITPALTFTDAYLPGEQFRWNLPEYQVEDDYTKVLPLDYFLAEITGRQIGCVSVLLPEFPAGGNRNRRNTEHLLALTRLHDVNVWPIWCDWQPVSEHWQALDRFGVDGDVTFLPYWETPPATCDADDVLISAYRRDDRALLVVSNYLDKTERTVNVTPDRELVGLPSDWHATDLMTGEAVARDGDAIRMTLPEARMRLIMLQP